jgi:transglutaminase-like putative cysteine protease
VRRAEGAPSLSVRLVLYAAACALLGWHVARVQEPSLRASVVVALALLGLAPALAAVAGGRLAAVGVVAAAVVAAAFAGAIQPLSLAHDLTVGASRWSEVVLPYSAAGEPELRATVVLATFAVFAALAWLWVVHASPLAAALVVAVPFLVVSSVFDLPAPGLRAACLCALVLAMLAAANGVGPSRVAPACALAAAAVALALAGASLPGVARAAFLPWTQWGRQGSTAAVAIRYVWDQSYAGIRRDGQPTVVLHVAARRPAYWRVTTLDAFDGVRWLQRPQAGRPAQPGSLLRVPPTPGARAPAAADSLHLEVTVDALDEPYLIGAGQPLAYQVPAGAVDATLLPSGAAITAASPPPGARYGVDVVLRDPTPAALMGAPAAYPPAVRAEQLGDLAGAAIPVWGTPGRERTVRLLLARSERVPGWRGWARAYAFARRVTRLARSPYAAVVALERAVRQGHGYDERVSLVGSPGAPLARWVVSRRPGYCQMFAGSTAELLRLLGIPARVAEGFTPGTWDAGSQSYAVSDRDAHAWVEVYVSGQGWLPVDPTPSGSAVPARPGGSALPGGLPALRSAPAALRAAAVPAASPQARGAWPQWLGAAGLVAGGVALLLLMPWTSKGLLRRRSAGAGARSRAAAAHGGLAAFALDQGVVVGRELTHAELAGMLDRSFAVRAGGWARAADEARFAEPSRSGASVAALERETRRLRRELRGSIGRRRRLRGALSLRSLRR